jgi:hypothetical protein
MKKIIAILFISIISKTSYSQSEVKGIDDVLLKIRINNNIDGTKNENYQNIEGNPYMFDNFQAGTVKLKNGNTFAGMLQYDIYAGTLYFKKNDTNYALDLPNEIDAELLVIRLNNGEDIVAMTYNILNDDEPEFYIVQEPMRL